MANLILTNYCSAACPFCFAAETGSRFVLENRRMMDISEIADWLDFTMAAGIKEMRLLGGEPTLHPQFADIVRFGREKGRTIRVFSNGVMPDAARDVLAELDEEVCSVVINITASVRPEDKSRQREVLRILGPRVILGMTLTSADFSLMTPVRLIETFGLQKRIRIGLSNAVWKGRNRSLHPKQYPAVGLAIFEQSWLTAKSGICLDADCGFVRCMFGPHFEQLAENGFRYISRCTPVLDQCAGGTIFPCFALASLLRKDQSDFQDSKQAFDHFNERLAPVHKFGIYPECTQCPYFETNDCCGGCLSARLCRLQPVEGDL